MERIQINGVWYRRETAVLTEEEPVNLEPSFSRTIVVEHSNLCLEASVHCADNDFTVSDPNYIMLEVTDKRVVPYKTTYWDNENWFRGVVDRDPESLKAFDKNEEDGMEPLAAEDRNFAIAFIDYLWEIQWIKRKQ